MDKEKRLTGLIIAAVVVIVGAMFLWRYVIDPGLQKAAQRRDAARAAAVAAAPAAARAAAAEPAAKAAAEATATRVAEPEMAEQAGDVAADSVAMAENKASEPVRAPVSAIRAARENLLRNSTFADGLAGWSAWPPGTGQSNALSVVEAAGVRNASRALRIENGLGEMIGVQQVARVVSGGVYRLSASVRSVATNDSSVMFGGRVACYMAGQKERELVWMSEYNYWWPKELVFTNETYDGAAVVYAHMGYGRFVSTGEFTDVRLERVW